MKKTVLLFAAAVLPLTAAAQAMQPGEWEFNSTLTSPMFPKPQVGSVTRCIAKEDAADPARLASGPSTQGCTVKPGAKTANSYEWEIACPAQGMTGSGSVRHSANAMDGNIKMQVDMQGQKTELQTKVSGRYIGPCKTK